MPDYKAHYEQLFDAVTEAIQLLRNAQIDTVDACNEELSKERSEKISAKYKTDIDTNSEKE